MTVPEFPLEFLFVIKGKLGSLDESLIRSWPLALPNGVKEGALKTKD